MTCDLVVIRQAMDLSCVEVDEKVVVVLDAVFVGGGFGALAVEVAATD